MMPRSRAGAQLLRAVLMGAVLAAPLAGCGLPDFMSFPPQVRGNRVSADLLKELVPGTSSRTDVASLIGSPTAKATFDDNTWLYITEVTKPMIGATNEVRDQQVLVLKFNQAGVLQSIDHKGVDDSLPVSVATRTTPAPGSDATIMQQLLGNVGKFSPGASGAGSSATGSGAGRGVSGAY
jgi:outer membrane protein assembly factor BamE (lipoprotein component of BamABCDE complex)